MKESTSNSLKRLLYFILPICSIALLIGVWLWGASVTNALPSPIEVVQRLKALQERPISDMGILGHIWVSFYRVLKALAFSILLGVPFGLLIGWNRKARSLLKPVFEMFRPIPPIAWIPLVSLWFGVGEISKVIIIFLGTFMPIVVNTFTGVRMIPDMLIDAAKSFGASPRQLFVDVIIPASAEAIMAGVKSALSIGWAVVLAAEMISAKQGLGFLILRGSDVNDLSLTLLAMVFIGLVGALMSYAFDYIKRIIWPWMV